MKRLRGAYWHRSRYAGNLERNRRSPRKAHGKLLPDLPVDSRGECWICGRYAGTQFGGRWWCYLHRPLKPRFRTRKPETVRVQEPAHPFYLRTPVSHSPDTKTSDIVKHQRMVDAKLGRKKRKASKPRKVARDRAYVR